MSNSLLLIGAAQHPTLGQQRFMRYLTGTLIDLVVLNLFAEFWHRVVIESFSASLLTAMLLQLLLKLTLVLEHRVAEFFAGRPGRVALMLRYLGTWGILFASKIVILEVVSFALGERMVFTGALHGVLAFIVVVTAMLIAEVAMVLLYRRLGRQG